MILKQNQVVCKRCSKVLTVANPKGLKTATCVCGICRSRIEVNFYVEDKVVATTLNEKKGVKATSLPVTDKVVEHTAFLLVDNHEYPLSIGNNIVGRWSPLPLSDIQLNVRDDYLSRQHLLINVYRLPNGNLRITVKNYNNKNETIVNGKPLGNDTLVVIDGDTITMADTVANLAVRPIK